jgi:hypothetical protein
LGEGVLEPINLISMPLRATTLRVLIGPAALGTVGRSALTFFISEINCTLGVFGMRYTDIVKEDATIEQDDLFEMANLFPRTTGYGLALVEMRDTMCG